jgi:hypothetical protein
MARPKGFEAAKLRQRKFELLRRLKLPAEALPGSLALTHRRCGKSTCHCAQGKGHPVWLLSFRAQGKTHVEWIPVEWAEEVRARVEAGRAFKEAAHEVLVANAKLLALERKQRRKPQRQKKARKRGTGSG